MSLNLPFYFVFIILISFCRNTFLKTFWKDRSIQLSEKNFSLSVHLGELQTHKSLHFKSVQTDLVHQTLPLPLNVCSEGMRHLTKDSLQQLQGSVVKGESGVSSQVQLLQLRRQVFW